MVVMQVASLSVHHLVVIGTRALAIVSTGDILIDGVVVDHSAQSLNAGPGAIRDSTDACAGVSAFSSSGSNKRGPGGGGYGVAGGDGSSSGPFSGGGPFRLE